MYQDILLEKDAIWLTTREKKNEIIEERSKRDTLPRIKVMTFEEISKRLFFNYDKRAVFYLVTEKKMRVDFAKTMLESMYLIEDASYKDKKKKELCSLKKELIEHGLLHQMPAFFTYIKNKKVYYEEEDLDDIGKKVISKLSEYTKVECILPKVLEESKKTVYEFSTIEEEVRFVIYKIIALYETGIPFSNMHLLNMKSEYNVVLPRLFSFYHIPLSLPDTKKLYGTVSGQKFLNRIKKGESLDSILEELKEEPYASELLEVANNYAWYQDDAALLYPLLESDLKEYTISSSKPKNGVRVENYFPSPKEDYYFLLGLNQENIPFTYHDDDYLSDAEKQELGLDSILRKNKCEKARIIRFMNCCKNLIVTYKQKSSFLSFFPSSIIEENHLPVEKGNGTFDTLYSSLDSKIEYATLLDEYIKFGSKPDELLKYYNHNPNLPYRTYQNDYTGIKKEALLELIENKLLLSYSSLNNYYKCRFRYYIENILKLSDYEETFVIKIGTVFHEVLEKAFQDGFDFEASYQKAIEGKFNTKKDLFFLRKLAYELRFIIETIKEQNKKSAFTSSMFEKKIYIEKEREIKVTFMGVVDKIFYLEKDGNTYVAILDYKTGSIHAALENVKYGLNMQLPIYLYLVQKSGLFRDITWTGFYLQKILSQEITFQKNKSFLDQKRESLKYVGYSNEEESLVELVDKDYQNSSVIQGMKTSSKGFYPYTKVMSSKKMEALIHFIDQKINDAITDILEAKFDINPKVIGKENEGCKYCKYKDLCYKKASDLVYLEEGKDLSFLGGEENA